jgi:hypothetical protein
MCQPGGVATPLRIGAHARLLSEPEGYFVATPKASAVVNLQHS